MPAHTYGGITVEHRGAIWFGEAVELLRRTDLPGLGGAFGGGGQGQIGSSLLFGHEALIDPVRSLLCLGKLGREIRRGTAPTEYTPAAIAVCTR